MSRGCVIPRVPLGGNAAAQCFMQMAALSTSMRPNP